MPHEFWTITPRELALLAKGVHRRLKRDMDLAAWITAHLLQPYSKKRITPKMLLGEGRSMTGGNFDELWKQVEAQRKRRKTELN